MKTYPVKTDYQIHFESLLRKISDFGDDVQTCV